MARPLKRDLTGLRFGRLLVVRREGSNRQQGQATWFCRCDCGAECVRLGSSLNAGTCNSCGCWRKEAPVVRLTTHGHAAKGKSRSRIYRIWAAMKNRCYNKNQNNYERYGGRGIRVCERWRNSFASFYQDMGEPPSLTHTLDRINNDGNYELENCRWATPKEQERNKGRNTEKYRQLLCIVRDRLVSSNDHLDLVEEINSLIG